MIQDLEQIEYRKGMLERSMKPKNLPLKVWRGGKIPGNVRAAVIDVIAQARAVVAAGAERRAGQELV